MTEKGRSKEAVNPTVIRRTERLKKIQNKSNEMVDDGITIDAEKKLLETQKKELTQEKEELLAGQTILAEQKRVLEREKQDLLTEQKVHSEQKKKLESDKRLFQTGFIATLSTTFLGFAGLIVRIPNSALYKRNYSDRGSGQEEWTAMSAIWRSCPHTV